MKSKHGMFLCQFSLNVFTEFAEFSDKKIVVIKRVRTCGLWYKREQDATIAPVRHRQWRIQDFPEGGANSQSGYANL